MGKRNGIMAVVQQKGRYHKKISRYIFTALLSVILALCLVIFLFSNKEINDRNANNDKKLLKYTQTTLEHMRQTAHSACLRIYNSADIIALMNTDAPADENELYTAIRQMDSVRKSLLDVDSFVCSVAVYSAKAGRMYSSTNGLNYTDHHLMELIALNECPSDTPIYRQIQHKNQPEDVLTFSVVEESASGEISCAVFVNIETDWIERQLQTLFDEEDLRNGCVFVVDRQGNIAASIGTSEELAKSFVDLYGTGLFSEKDHTVLEKIKLGPDRYYYSGAYAAGLDMEIVRLQTVASVSAKMQNYWLMIILISALSLVVASVVARAITAVIYQPIGNLAKRVSDEKRPSETAEFDEFVVLNKAYASLGDIHSALLDSQKISALVDILRSGEESTVDPASFSKYSNLRVDLASPMTVIIVRLDINCKTEAHESLNLIAEQIDQQLHMEYLPLDILAAACIVQTATEADRRRLISILEEGCQSNSAINYAVGISNRIPDLYALSTAYEEAQEAISRRFFYGARAVLPIEYHTVSQRNVWQDHLLVFRAEEKVLSDIKHGRLAKLDSSLDEYLAEYSSYSYNDLAFFRSHLVCSVGMLINQLNQLRITPVKFNLPRLSDAQANCCNIVQLREVLLQQLKQLCSEAQVGTDDKHAAVVQIVKDILEAEYAEPSLCLNSIAERISLSPNYVGRIFKTETGLSVAAYLGDLRLQRAANWIADSNMKINLIIERVGFVNESNFYKSFKQKYGVTPKEYAIAMRNQVEENPEG